jgi:hypothetical protein
MRKTYSKFLLVFVLAISLMSYLFLQSRISSANSRTGAKGKAPMELEEEPRGLPLPDMMIIQKAFTLAAGLLPVS